MTDTVWSHIFADPADHERVPWSRDSLHFTAASATCSLLSFQIIDDWIRYRQVRYPQFQVNRPTGGVPPTAFTETRKYLALSMMGSPVTELIAEQLEGGATLRFVDIEDWYPPVTEICVALGATLNCISRAYAFYTPPGDDGVHAHWDDADIFAIQVDGSKTWRLWDVPEIEEWPESQTLDGDRVPDKTVELHPGEGLYIPAGMGHQAVAGPEGSLHMSIALRPPTHREIADMWAAVILGSVPAGARLPVVGDREARIREILDHVQAAAQKVDPAGIIARANRVEERLVSDAPLIAGARPRGHAGHGS
jgi:hypothetical protein